MTITMNDSHVVSIAQIKAFAKISKDIEFQGASRTEKYAWTEEVLGRFRYFSLKKKEKSIVKGYAMKMTGFSDAQLTRLIQKKRKTGRIARAVSVKRHSFSRIYGTKDIALSSIFIQTTDQSSSTRSWQNYSTNY